jgi:hypothetical protein
MPEPIHRMDFVLGGRIPQSVLPSLAMRVLPKPTLSPVPPVSSGADQARFSAQLSYFAFLKPNSSIASPRPLNPAPPSALSRSFMRSEHYGNFSVAHRATRVLPTRLNICSASLDG